ncbi:Uncharacterised protein [Bordetella pertussis]|nr:Uncharacterised protein [Bordetella pertussis]
MRAISRTPIRPTRASAAYRTSTPREMVASCRKVFPAVTTMTDTTIPPRMAASTRSLM